MHIPRIDHLILGYREISFSEDDIACVVDILLKNGLEISIKHGVARLSVSKYKELERVLSGNVSYKVTEVRGFYGLLLRFLRHPAALAVSVFFLLFFLFSSGVVWDVRIEGADPSLSEKIRSDLEDAGLKVGMPWSRIDKSELENNVLIDSDHISWVNINRRGTVAYVKVVEKNVHGEDPSPIGYANVVAARDCVIEEIRVNSGYACVKPGDTVRKGEVLISGAFPNELGGGLCYADGVVIGRYSDSVSVSVSKLELRSEIIDEGCQSIYLKFFGFSLKVFKIYRNLPNNCVIIEDERQLSVPGGKKLPLSVIKNRYFVYGEQERILSVDEMVLLAQEKMKDALAEGLKDRELIKIKTFAQFREDGYVMTSDIICTSDVGIVREFEADVSE